MTKKKKSNGKYAAGRKTRKGLKIAIVLVALLLAAMAALLLLAGQDDEIPGTETTVKPTQTSLQTSPANETETQQPPAVNLGYGIYVTDIGSYTGVYMEDGTDEVLSGILMMVVKNDSEQDIQYAEITMDLGENQAHFQLTTLPAGQSMVLLEKNRMPWDADFDYEAVLPAVNNVAYFQTPISLQEEKLKIQIADGALNVTNISQEDIPGTIKVYYKNAAEDLLYGGITYQVTIDGGLAAGQLRQVMTKHASDTGSKIMFVTIVP